MTTVVRVLFSWFMLSFAMFFVLITFKPADATWSAPVMAAILGGLLLVGVVNAPRGDDRW